MKDLELKKKELFERIHKIREHYELSERQFCKSIEVSPNFLQEKRDVGFFKLLRIIEEYPEISMNWLLLGEKPMIAEPVDTIKIMKLIEEYDEKLASLLKEIKQVMKQSKKEIV